MEPENNSISYLCSGMFGVIALGAILGIYWYKKFSRTRPRPVPYRRLEQFPINEKKSSALVVGGNGSLGKALINCLLSDATYQVHSLDLCIPIEGTRNPQVTSYIQSDVTNRKDLATAFKGIDTVFHTASLLPQLRVSTEDMYRVNTEGTMNVIAACRENHIKRLIYTSTFDAVWNRKGVYSKPSGMTYPNTNDPAYPYGRSKALAEEAVCKANGTNGLLTSVLRPGIILAADSYFTPSLMQRVYTCKEATYCHINYAPVEAIAKAHLLTDKQLCLDSVAAGKAYFVSGPEISLYDLYNHISSAAGQLPPIVVPKWLLYALAYFNFAVYSVFGFSPFGSNGNLLTPGSIFITYVDRRCDSTPACEELGWDMDFPPLEVILKDVLQGYKQLLLGRK